MEKWPPFEVWQRRLYFRRAIRRLTQETSIRITANVKAFQKACEGTTEQLRRLKEAFEAKK